MVEQVFNEMKKQKLIKSFNELPRQCYLCGRDNVLLTEEHLPPKCLFPKEEWSKLLVAPSCESCNSKRRRDDEFFRDYIFLWSGKENVPAQMWGKMKRSWQKNPSHKIGIQRNMRIAWIKNEHGILVPQLVARAEKHRIEAVLDNMARGFHFSKWGKRISNLQGEVYIDAGEPTEFIYRLVQEIAIPDMFEIWFNSYKNGAENIANWCFVFFKVVKFRVQFSWEEQ